MKNHIEQKIESFTLSQENNAEIKTQIKRDTLTSKQKQNEKRFQPTDIFYAKMKSERLTHFNKSSVSEESNNFIQNSKSVNKKTANNNQTGLNSKKYIQKKHNDDLELNWETKNSHKTKLNLGSHLIKQKNFFMAAMFCEPLKEFKEKKINFYPPVNFIKELRKIQEFIASKSQDTSFLKVAPLNIDNFFRTLCNSPEIIHFMSHGRLIKNESNNDDFHFEFDFESLKSFKESLDKKNIEELVSMNKLENTHLVFLNGCYSGNIGEFFIKMGANCVVQVNKNFPINDSFASQFAVKFYSYALQKNFRFLDAFRLTKLFFKHDKNCENLIKKIYVFCNHQHLSNCFQNKKNNKSKENFINYFKSFCKCEFKVENLHNLECKIIIEQKAKENNYQLIIKSVQKQNKDFYKICCCREDLKHSEIDKYEILLHPENNIKDSMSDFLKAKNPFYRRNLYFYERASIRMNFDRVYDPKRFHEILFKLHHFFIFNRGKIGMVFGMRGSGIRQFLEHFSCYAFYREKYHLVSKLNFSKVLDHNIMKELLKVEIKRLQDLIKCDYPQINKSSIGVLILCHECDAIVEKLQNIQIYKILEEVECYTFEVNYLFTLRKKPENTNNIRVLELKPLSLTDAFNHFLKEIDKGEDNHTKFQEDCEKRKEEIKNIFKEFPTYPKYIMKFVNMIKEKHINIKEWTLFAKKVKKEFDKKNS